MEDEFNDYEEEANRDCPKCGRPYDEIGYEYKYCKACGWDAANEKWDKPTEPTDADYLSGDADILTGRWY